MRYNEFRLPSSCADSLPRTLIACATICTPVVGIAVIAIHMIWEPKWTRWLLDD